MRQKWRRHSIEILFNKNYRNYTIIIYKSICIILILGITGKINSVNLHTNE